MTYSETKIFFTKYYAIQSTYTTFVLFLTYY
jgi:hypothetical protein